MVSLKSMSWSAALLIGLASCSTKDNADKPAEPKQFSGVYPHLAYYNKEGECGTGAVVPWADRLWVITYGPHLPFGSSDKLYEISDDLTSVIRKESIGGTPANRLIHKESNQLFIGPYAIDAQRNVRVIPYTEAPGRYTGAARHLTDPAKKIYLATMEEGFYEVDVNTLAVNMLYEDANVKKKKGDDISINQPGSLLPGAHGKGAYSGQGVLIYSNNGEPSEEALRKFDIEAGVLAEWDGKNWKVVRRAQFVEVTGPGGIYGNENPATDPIWATGWDHRSVILALRDKGKWHFYRLPKASHSYDGAHGWNTEWPRIRDVGTPGKPDYLMTMHGMFWRFPGTFTADNSAGIRPRSAYLKVIGDFARWNDKLVFGCDDSAQKEFLNKRKVKGSIEGPGQSNSNLWFTSPDLPDQLGPSTAEGAVWLNEDVKANESSEPFLFAGWPKRVAWISNDGDKKTSFSFEVDEAGTGNWKNVKSVSVEPHRATMVEFGEGEKGEWIRVRTDKAVRTTVHFYYGDADDRRTKPDEIFKGLAYDSSETVAAGLLYGIGEDKGTMGVAAVAFEEGQAKDIGYYELNADMELQPKENQETYRMVSEQFAIPRNVITIDEASVLITDDKERRWRLPLGSREISTLTHSGAVRVAREVSTERDLFNCAGTFYELPAENADGFAKIRPISSHPFRIHDYASFRGLLIMSGVNLKSEKDNPHIITSADGKAAVWAGVIDDLWKLGKPVGHGGPWKDSQVHAGVPSDPYLIGFYDDRTLTIRHDHGGPVTFRIEVEPVGHGPWMLYKEVTVAAGETYRYKFPDNFQSRWIRFTADQSARATAWLVYE